MKKEELDSLVAKKILTPAQAEKIIQETQNEGLKGDLKEDIVESVTPSILAGWIVNISGGKYSPNHESRTDGIQVTCPTPDHEDRNPSCTVSYWDGKTQWKCFSKCNAGGDVFDWAKLAGKGETFPEQMQYIAELLGLETGEGANTPRQNTRTSVPSQKPSEPKVSAPPPKLDYMTQMKDSKISDEISAPINVGLDRYALAMNVPVPLLEGAGIHLAQSDDGVVWRHPVFNFSGEQVRGWIDVNPSNGKTTIFPKDDLPPIMGMPWPKRRIVGTKTEDLMVFASLTMADWIFSRLVASNSVENFEHLAYPTICVLQNREKESAIILNKITSKDTYIVVFDSGKINDEEFMNLSNAWGEQRKHGGNDTKNVLRLRLSEECSPKIFLDNFKSSNDKFKMLNDINSKIFAALQEATKTKVFDQVIT